MKGILCSGCCRWCSGQHVSPAAVNHATHLKKPLTKDCHYVKVSCFSCHQRELTKKTFSHPDSKTLGVHWSVHLYLLCSEKSAPLMWFFVILYFKQRLNQIFTIIQSLILTQQGGWETVEKNNFSVPAEERHSQSLMLPPPSFTCHIFGGLLLIKPYIIFCVLKFLFVGWKNHETKKNKVDYFL